jgi:hypothetical protein
LIYFASPRIVGKLSHALGIRISLPLLSPLKDALENTAEPAADMDISEIPRESVQQYVSRNPIGPPIYIQMVFPLFATLTLQAFHNFSSENMLKKWREEILFYFG